MEKSILSSQTKEVEEPTWAQISTELWDSASKQEPKQEPEPQLLALADQKSTDGRADKPNPAGDQAKGEQKSASQYQVEYWDYRGSRKYAQAYDSLLKYSEVDARERKAPFDQAGTQETLGLMAWRAAQQAPDDKSEAQWFAKADKHFKDCQKREEVMTGKHPDEIGATRGLANPVARMKAATQCTLVQYYSDRGQHQDATAALTKMVAAM